MSIVPQQSGTVPRARRPFTFAVNGSEFFPGAGSSLHFASKDDDTLTLVNLPEGVLAAGDSVTVAYLGKTVFAGTVDSIVDERARGDSRRQRIVCKGPWGALSRLVFRQTWHVGADLTYSSPRVVLNQSAAGLDQNMTDTVKEICSFAAPRCGFSYSASNVSVADVFLPKDETRDVTCADAIRRELRFFPRKIVRFDYSAVTPALHISEPDTSRDAAYVSSIPKSARRYEYTAHPIRGVDVYTADVDTTVSGSEISQNHQFYGEPGVSRDDIDVLHCYIPLAPGTSSTTYESLEVTTEEIGSVGGVVDEREWWRTKHPRLNGVANAALTITDFGYPLPSFSPRRITDCTVGALRKFGLKAELVRFHCRARIETADDVEDDIYLTMDFVVTNASTRVYTQQTGSSASAGETLPEGLAKAIYDQRCGDLKNETMTIRLGDAFPTLGDACDGLVLQEYDVDCDALTAELHFGVPEYVSAEDMRSLLNGFRMRGYASNAVIRGTGEPDEEDAVDFAGIQPVASTEFCPGTKAKTTIKASSGGTVVLDSKSLEAGETARLRTVTLYDKAGNPSNLKVLATERKPGEGEDDPEDEKDPHGQKDEHAAPSNDPCNPGGSSDSDGSGGGGGAGVSPDGGSGGESGQSGRDGGAGVSAGGATGSAGGGESGGAPGCGCD